MSGDRPRFSELLLDRRQRLGLTLEQASQVLRLKPQVLLAFEEGDFEQMPKSGYAQGMLASYARYLGLNPKQVTDQYAADLDAYLRGGGGRRGSRGRVVTHEASPGVSAPMPRYEGARGLLPTSGGLAGDYGAFATTTAVPRGRTASVSDRGISTSPGWEMEEGMETADVGERRYTTRAPSGTGRTRGSRGSSRASGYAGRSYYASDRVRSRDQVTTRQVGRGQYVDDLSYGSARPFDAASTTSGRMRSRDIASTRRPNVQRRRPTGVQQPPRHGGVLGVIEAFFSDTRRAVVTIVGIAGIVLAVFIVSSIRSCIANQSMTGRTVEVTQEEVSSTADEDAQSDDARAADEQALADAAATHEQRVVPAKTVVTVSVADGMVSWLDIQCDGKGIIADTVTGPWEQTFTIADSITIEVSDTTSVSVTENGEMRQFDSRASGIGTITIENAAKAAAEAAGTTVGDATTEGDAGEQDAYAADGLGSDDGEDQYYSDEDIY